MQDDLDDMFAAARHPGAEPSPGLLARVLADAEAVQDGWKTAPPAASRVVIPVPRIIPRALSEGAPRAASRPPRGGWPRLLALLLGGAGATAGMATAALAGVWIGYAQPGTLSTVAAALWVDQRVDLIPSYDFTTE